MNYHRMILLMCLCFISYSVFAQEQTTYKIWEEIPGVINSAVEEQKQLNDKGELQRVSKVSEPDIRVFLPQQTLNSPMTAVLICPGGGYSHLAIDKEGYKVAKWLNSIGVAAMVLKYRLPDDRIMTDKKLGPLQDAQQAIRYIRAHAGEWNIDVNRVGVMGFSAGGHLAASLATMYDKSTYSNKLSSLSARPDFSVLVYPVISMEDNITHKGSQENLLGKKPSSALKKAFSPQTLVDSNTPPTFLVHATNDKAVPEYNSLVYYRALLDNEVPAELHLYNDGGHGFGLGNTASNKQWPTALENWLGAIGMLSDQTVYLFSYFKANGQDGLHYAYSTDGYNWEALNGDHSFLSPNIGNEKLIRDPCIIKGGDGKYHMVWTCGWKEKGIGYASSLDLIHWSDQQYIGVMEHQPKARNCWAPELTYDVESDTYMIYWATTVEGEFPQTQSTKENAYNHRIYYTTTKDFKEFTKTKLLYQPGFNVIDASIVAQGESYLMFLKDETIEPAEKNIRIAYSEELTGPYSEASAPITGDYWAEGPTSLMLEAATIVYFDKYIDKQYGGVKSSDLKHWEDISDQLSFPKGMRHGSVIKIPAREFLKNFKEYID